MDADYSFEVEPYKHGVVITSLYVGYIDTMERSPKHIVIPETIDGKPVLAVKRLFRWLDEYEFGVSCPLESIIIPDTVEEFGERLFLCCKNLKEITIPKNLKKIGKKAFFDCSALESIELPEGITELEDETFFFSGIQSITAPKVEKLGNKVFYGESFNTVDGFFIVGSCLVKYTGQESHVEIPEDVSFVADLCFSENQSIEVLTFHQNVKVVQKESCSYCQNLKEVHFLNSMAELPASTFQDCGSLEKVTLPNTLKTIEEAAFSHCTSLKEISLPSSVTHLEKESFMDCASLEEIVIPSHIVEIQKDAFKNCKSLRQVVLPDSLTLLAEGTFQACLSLTSITLPKGVGTLLWDTFSDCTSLKEINICGDSITVRPMAFGGCTEISVINPFHQSVLQQLPQESQCKVLLNQLEQWDKVEESTQKIIESFLKNNISLNALLLEESTEESKSLLHSLGIVEQSTTSESNSFQTLWYYEKGEDGLRILGYKGQETSVTIPHKTPDGERITSVGYGKECSFQNLEKILLEEGIETVEANTFYHCDKLKEIVLPETLENIGRAAFFSCTGLTTVTLPSKITALKDSTFSGCSSLTRVTLPETLEKIGHSAFSDCSQLVKPENLNSVKSVHQCAFLRCPF